MATGARRDDEEIRDGLARWVAAHPEEVPGPSSGEGRAPAVTAVTHASGGMANETLLVELGPRHPGIVVRLPPLEPTFPGYDLAPQAAVQNAVAACGVPAPAPAVVVDDPSWVGASFLAMPRVRGDIPGPAPLYDPYVRDAGATAQRLLHDGLLQTLVAIHAVPWHVPALRAALPDVGLGAAFGRWEAYVAWAAEGDPLPALSDALAWCGEHLPSERPSVLLWGDVRLGNLVFDPNRHVHAVLDWDLAALGPPEMDLGWHLGLERMMEALFGSKPPGFPSADGTRSQYEDLRGEAVHDLDWHEVFALVRALAINDRHQRITNDARRRDNPMGRVLLERLAELD